METMPVVLLGFLLGMLHAADADHVVAVATLIGRERSIGGAARLGLLWGAGHTAMVFAVGSAIILFSLVIPPRLEQAMEFCVALMLILLGVVTLSQLSRLVRDTLTASLAVGVSASAGSGAVVRWTFRPVAIGVVHGLAGSTAVALLVLTKIREPAWAVAYLLLFGIGTTAGMTLITGVIAHAFVRARRVLVLNVGAQLVAGALSLVFGGWMAWKLGS